jgi:hypothetical protein
MPVWKTGVTGWRGDSPVSHAHAICAHGVLLSVPGLYRERVPMRILPVWSAPLPSFRS